MTAYDTAGKPVASFSNASGSPARLPLSDENGGVAPRMAILATDGTITLEGVSLLDDEVWMIEQTTHAAESSTQTLAEGHGAIALAPAQRTALLARVQAHPGTVEVRWKTQSQVLYPALGDAQWKTCIDPQQRGMQACGAGWAVQERFSASPFAADYAKWQDAFAADVRGLVGALRDEQPPNPALQAAMEDPSDDTALAKLFTNSIADTPKGRSLKRFILSAWKQQQQSGGGPETATIFIRQVLGNPDLAPSAATTTAVGYGGSVVDGDYRPEVFYIMPPGLRTLSPGGDKPSKRQALSTLAVEERTDFYG